jgi:hypothetical protein
MGFGGERRSPKNLSRVIQSAPTSSPKIKFPIPFFEVWSLYRASLKRGGEVPCRPRRKFRSIVTANHLAQFSSRRKFPGACVCVCLDAMTRSERLERAGISVRSFAASPDSLRFAIPRGTKPNGAPSSCFTPDKVSCMERYLDAKASDGRRSCNDHRRAQQENV